MPNHHRLPVLALCCLAALAACRRPAQAPAASATAAQADTSGYAAPPALRAARHSAAGGVELDGVSRPGAQVRLLAPDGEALPVTADATGGWELRAASTDPRLYALAELVGGRLVRSPGYVAILPPPGVPAVVLRPGAGARLLGVARAQPVITAVDFDRGGAGVVSGLATPGQVLRLRIDGAEAGEGRSDAAGGFSISLSDMLKPGAHTAVVRAAPGQAVSDAAHVDFSVAPPAAAFTPPLLAQRTDSGWRLDWLTPGGGVQTTLVFDTEPRA